MAETTNICSGDWESKIKPLADSMSGENFLVHRCLLALFSLGGRGDRALWGLSDQGTDPIHQSFSLVTEAPSRPHLLRPPWGVSVLARGGGRGGRHKPIVCFTDNGGGSRLCPHVAFIQWFPLY